jgi:(1->4)-alpha-D-glucan 1-alpha-D-glucosylmutase
LDAEGRTEFIGRVQAYMEKATREAKLHTSWINPNEEYDRSLKEFIGKILAGENGTSEFLDDLTGFQQKIAAEGMYNSLSQTLLKLALPGVPDVYQGQEVWDFSMVDPDNRRAVDYPLRGRMLEELKQRSLDQNARGELLREVLEGWDDGRIKMLVTHLLLQERLASPDLLLEGDYLPLEVVGQHAEHVFAFARRIDEKAMIVVAPRLPWTFRRATGSGFEVGSAWGDTAVVLPGDLQQAQFCSLFKSSEIRAKSGDGAASLPVGDLLDGFPVALLERS